MDPNSTSEILRDEEGFLIEPEDWSEAVAEELAAECGLTLTPDHWDVIRFMRDHYDEHRVAVDARFVIKYLSETKGAGRNYLFELFPYGYVQQTCKIAGMRRPRAWSVG
ncbi:MAG: TusE/DsrC/DsvC family sulfur relay protein [Gammaproteobacteria bacterium]|nr:TusE/DsrC/DsvC family sulfur relay protein [Gammaproteobacteria bacterium]